MLRGSHLHGEQLLSRFGSIVAISAIGLQDFTEIGNFSAEDQFWRIMLHLTFLLSGVGFAFMDWLGEKRLILAKISHSED